MIDKKRNRKNYYISEKDMNDTMIEIALCVATQAYCEQDAKKYTREASGDISQDIDEHVQDLLNKRYEHYNFLCLRRAIIISIAVVLLLAIALRFILA